MLTNLLHRRKSVKFDKAKVFRSLRSLRPLYDLDRSISGEVVAHRILSKALRNTADEDLEQLLWNFDSLSIDLLSGLQCMRHCGHHRVDGRHIIEDDEAEASRPLRSRIIFDLDRLDVAILPEVIFQFVFARLTDTTYENLGALVVVSHRARSVSNPLRKGPEKLNRARLNVFFLFVIWRRFFFSVAVFSPSC